MKKYFYAENDKKVGPLSLEELSTSDVNKDTLVWFQGLEDWTPMSEIEELKSVLEIKPPPIPIVPPPVPEVMLNLETPKDIPPPLSNQNNPESTSFSKPLKFFLIIIVVFIASAIGTSLGTWSFESNEKTAQKKINEQDDANQFYKDQSIKESEVQKPKNVDKYKNNIDLIKVSKDINKKLPMVLDEYTTYLSTAYLGRTFIYNYQLDEQIFKDYTFTKSDWIEDRTAILKNGYCKSLEFEHFKYWKIPIVYNYTDLNKNVIAVIKVNLYDCYKLGDQISIKGHKKAKGVNMEIRKPINMELMEGDLPNTVMKFNEKSDNLIYLISTQSLPQFYSRGEVEEKFASPENFKEVTNTMFKSLEPLGFKNLEFVSSKLVKVDNYPALQITGEKKIEQYGITWYSPFSSWHIYFEDRIVTLYGTILFSEDIQFENYLLILDLITSSVVFPDQYDEIYSPDEDNFDQYLDKFYRELDAFGIYPIRPNDVKIELKNLEDSNMTSHLHGYSSGYNNDDKIEIYINEKSWKSMNKATKHWLIFHELCHDVLNLRDLSPEIKNKYNTMYPGVSKYNRLNMDDFITNFHELLQSYSESKK